jgi:hypothetical protein
LFIALREKIVNTNSTLSLHNSVAIMENSPIDITDLVYRRGYIISEYGGSAKNNHFHNPNLQSLGIIQRYKDKVILTLFKDLNEIKKSKGDYANDANIYNEINNYLNTNIIANNNNSTKKIIFLVLNYVYYLVCKLKHNERLYNPSFVISHTKLDVELTLLNTIFSAFIADLIKET